MFRQKLRGSQPLGQGRQTFPGAPKAIDSVLDLRGDYDVVLCDVWGVIHDGRAVFPGVAPTLEALRAAGLVVVLVTNVPRPGSTLPEALHKLGFPRTAWDAAVTSGDAIRAELAARAPGPVAILGRTSDAVLWAGLDLDFTEHLERAAFVAISGLSKDAPNPQDYDADLKLARDRDLELLCANPDVQVMVGQRLSWCAGAVAARYSDLGGRVVQSGKPHEPIYRMAVASAEAFAGGPTKRERILAIGDGLGTDILGANRFGLDSLFIATGVHGTNLLTDGRSDGSLDRDRLDAALSEAGVHATYAMATLA